MQGGLRIALKIIIHEISDTNIELIREQADIGFEKEDGIPSVCVSEWVQTPAGRKV